MVRVLKWIFPLVIATISLGYHVGSQMPEIGAIHALCGNDESEVRWRFVFDMIGGLR